ncbi:MAG: ATP-dependent sacrificial sulfur transferase LarE [Lachnospiraceae bacterium]|nr:ATP-dependent sacrificial sulfur transferase LarE [Lachnospiraceae bacterium]
MRDRLEQKYGQLLDRIASAGKAAVAFSGGVDSVFLLYAAHQALSRQVLALTVSLHAVPKRELQEAVEFCKLYGIRHLIHTVDEFEIEGFADNPPNRCYLCKKALFIQMLELAGKEGYTVLMEGSNVDDQGDYRPGMQALKELQIQSPLKDCGFTKADIREMSKRLGLPAWDKPSMACLASRFVYGQTITPEKMKMVEEAEEYLTDLGFIQRRVRMHGDLARIELLSEDLPKLMEENKYRMVQDRLNQLGFAYVTLDLHGFESGSMNKGLKIYE